jgi:Neprosin
MIHCLLPAGLVLACSSQGTDASTPSAPSSQLRTTGAIAPTSTQVGTSTADSGLDSPDEIQSFIDHYYYQDSDIQHTFHTIFGERIDCIDFYAQYSVRATLAAGLAVPPPAAPPVQNGNNAPPSLGPDAFLGALDDDGQARQCLGNTVPTMRPTVADVQAAGGIPAFSATLASVRPRDSNESKHQWDCYEIPNSTVLQQVVSGTAANNYADNNYGHSVGYQAVSYCGLFDYVSVNNPSLYNTTDHSLSQVWVQTGECEMWLDTYGCQKIEGDGLNEAVQSIETGWWVGYPFTASCDGVPGDSATHLFAYTTVDGYYQQGWLAAGCHATPGSPWVAYPSSPYMIGMQLNSTNGSPAIEMSLNVAQGSSPEFEAWYININGYTVGWYPWGASGDSPGYWGSMLSNATYLQAGGEVFDGNQDSDWTNTAMGSGVYPTSSNYANAAYLRNLQYFSGSCQNDSGTWYNASLSFISGLPSYEDDEGKEGTCGYEAGLYYQKCNETCDAPDGADWGSYLYFGGTP